MKIGKFLVLLLMNIFLMVGSCLAFDGVVGTYDPKALADMNKNPKNYILYGGLGTDVGAYIYKNSIDVQQYSPPEYIIAFKNIYYITLRNKNVYVKSTVKRYKYNFKEKKMYLEIQKDGRTEWQRLNPLELQRGVGGQRAILAAGEISFYLAYKMSFFDEPMTDFAKKVINGSPEFFKS